jgi:hypothetical protein
MSENPVVMILIRRFQKFDRCKALLIHYGGL